LRGRTAETILAEILERTELEIGELKRKVLRQRHYNEL